MNSCRWTSVQVKFWWLHTMQASREWGGCLSAILKHKCKDSSLIIPSGRGCCWPLFKICIIQNYWGASIRCPENPNHVWYGWLLPNSIDLWELKFQVLIWNLLLSVTSKSKSRVDYPFPEPARSNIIAEVHQDIVHLTFCIFSLYFSSLSLFHGHIF